MTGDLDCWWTCPVSDLIQQDDADYVKGKVDDKTMQRSFIAIAYFTSSFNCSDLHSTWHII